jgi:cytochrome P450
MLPAVAAAAAAFALGWLAYILLWRPLAFAAHFARHGVRGPRFRPLLGELPEIISSVKSSDCFSWSKECHAKFGRSWVSFFGPLPRLVIADAELAQDVLTRQHACYNKSSEGRRIMKPLLGNGLFFSEGELWKRQRALINPAFHAVCLQQMVGLMETATRECVQRWLTKNSGADGHVRVELHREMAAVTLDIVASATLGSSFRDRPEVNAAVYTAFCTVLHELQERSLGLIGLVPLLEHLPTPAYRRIWRGVAEIRRIVMGVIEARRRGECQALTEGRDLLDLILAARHADSGDGMSEEMLRDEAMTFMLAGHETTALLMTWTLAELARRPALWAACRAEALSAAAEGGGRWTWDILKRLPLIDAVLSETLRYHPPVPLLRRIAVRDHQLSDGTLVPAGTPVSINVFLLHRSKAHWGEDADEFRPERFMSDEGGVRRHSHCYLPFGVGPRKCIGMQFARIEAKMILATLVTGFGTLELEEGTLVVPELSLTLRSKHPLPARLRPKA